MNTEKVNKQLLISALFGFFIMGFCDIVAPVTGSVIVNEFSEEQGGAVFFLPTMVFFWFLFLSVPISSLMNHIGRKSTAFIGYLLTLVGLLLPLGMGETPSLNWYYAAFGILGLGNTFVQVSMNPLLATIVPAEKMTSYLTIGQVFRNTALMLVGPLVTCAVYLWGDNSQLAWHNILYIYAAFTLIGGILLQSAHIPEAENRDAASFADCFKLLRNKVVLISALGIACFIAADIGVNFVAGKLIDTSSSILTSTGFYICRIVGTLIGAWVLVKISDVKYLRWNMALALVLCVVLFLWSNPVAVYTAMGLMGFAMSCVFATFYAAATKAEPIKANAVAGLMIMAISGGGVACPACGSIISMFDGESQMGLLFVIACVLYMLWASFKLKTEEENA